MRLGRALLTGLLGVALLSASAPVAAAVEAWQVAEACHCPMHRMPAAPSVRAPCCCEQPSAPAPTAPPSTSLAADGSTSPHAAPPALAAVDAFAHARSIAAPSPITTVAPRGPPLFLLASSLRR